MRGPACFVCALLLAGAVHAEPDAALLGEAQGYPIGTLSTWTRNPYRIGSFSAIDRVPGVNVRAVPAPAQPRALPRATATPDIRYRFRQQDLSLADYLERQRVTGLLVLKDGTIVAEHYRYGRTEDASFLSFSMAKSITSLLVGTAHARGAIASLDDAAERYVPALAGSAYGATRIRDLLRMSSGLVFTERYDGIDDAARLGRAFAVGPSGTLEVLRSVGERHSPPGATFRYASAETEVLGRVLAGATGRTVAALTSEWLWQPLGAEHAAAWRVGGDGQEGASGHFSARLRDWGRLGLLLAADGRVGDQQVVPRDYLLEATDAARHPDAFRPGSGGRTIGYGYQFWLLPYRERTFALQGVYGQAVYVQPATGIVMVQTSAWQMPSAQQDPLPGQERGALWRGVLQSLGGRTD